MNKKAFASKGAIVVGGAIAFCGLTLFAAEQVLDYLFRDVDPKRKEEIQNDEDENDETEVMETEDAATDPV